jgi:hypothetical protein
VAVVHRQVDARLAIFRVFHGIRCAPAGSAPVSPPSPGHRRCSDRAEAIMDEHRRIRPMVGGPRTFGRRSALEPWCTAMLGGACLAAGSRHRSPVGFLVSIAGGALTWYAMATPMERRGVRDPGLP